MKQETNMEHSAEWLRGAYRIASRYAPMDVVMQINVQLAAAEAREAGKLSKAQWIERYGGQVVLDREGFDVVPCVNCGESICHGWRVVRRRRRR